MHAKAASNHTKTGTKALQYNIYTWNTRHTQTLHFTGVYHIYLGSLWHDDSGWTCSSFRAPSHEQFKNQL